MCPKDMIAVSAVSFVSGSILGCVGVPTLSENGTDAGGHGRINWFRLEPCCDEFCCLGYLVDAGIFASPSAPPIQIPSLSYDPAHAALPNQKLTGDTFSGVELTPMRNSIRRPGGKFRFSALRVA